LQTNEKGKNMKLGTITTRYGVADIVSTGTYALDNSPVIQLFFQDGEPLMRLTVCIEGSNLQPGEILVKTWSENEPFIAPILALGLFEDTGRRVPSGFVEAQVWRKI
jgi:ABC-type lipoprotein release transport system permease subunit